MAPDEIVATIDLTKRYGKALALDGVSLAVRSGEAFGLLGPNGAGKTTLIRTVLGLLHPTSGTSRVFGLDSRRDAVAIHARLGNLAGDFACDPRLTGRELLRLCAHVRGMRDLGCGEQLAERFQADLDKRVGELSRGNRQKIGLIQAFFHEPELLILDEPTSGFDPLMQEEFLALIGEHVARGGTLLMSSHDLDEVQRSCSRVAIIRDGRLAAVEDVDDLRGRSVRHVRVRFAGFIPDATTLEALPGVEGVEMHDGEARFRVTGTIDAVVKELAHHDIADLEILEPSLEEVFVTFYGGAAAA